MLFPSLFSFVDGTLAPGRQLTGTCMGPVLSHPVPLLSDDEPAATYDNLCRSPIHIVTDQPVLLSVLLPTLHFGLDTVAPEKASQHYNQYELILKLANILHQPSYAKFEHFLPILKCLFRQVSLQRRHGIEAYTWKGILTAPSEIMAGSC